jgi:hypothetical protein
MRNTIHSDALRSVTWQSPGTRDERIVVPAATAERLVEITSRLGSPADFGLSPESGFTIAAPGASPRERQVTYVEPGVYVEAVFPLVARAMNAIMDATPVDKLPGVDAGTLLRPPKNDEGRAATRARIRLLAGL